MLAVFIGWLVVLVLHALSQGKASETPLFLYFGKLLCCVLSCFIFLFEVQSGLLMAGPAAGFLQWIGFLNVSFDARFYSVVAVLAAKRVVIWRCLRVASVIVGAHRPRPLRSCTVSRTAAVDCRCSQPTVLAWLPPSLVTLP